MTIKTCKSTARKCGFRTYFPFDMGSHEGLVYTGVPSLMSQLLEINPCYLICGEHEDWELPLHTWPQVLHPKYDMDAYMATLFEGETWSLC